MAAANSRRSNGSVYSSSAAFRRSISPTGRRYSSPSSSAASFSSRSPSFFHRSSSPTRVNFVGFAPPTSSVRFSIDRPTSPGRSLAFASPREHHSPQRRPITAAPAGGQRKTCMCSPTNHPGSFRCNLHKGFAAHGVGGRHHYRRQAVSSPSNRLNARRSAMTNSLVRIGTVEGEWVRRALAALIHPSSHHQRRRAAFHPRPSRLSIMSKADDP
ncbi:uncharacterized protein LOC103706534 [Phoenix dactylifera]|uniref:Uncharacterized protein LOC103706534 n=1 Tax=Phoenix dactylifera TaxID=42345 RepID=A0A8B9ABL0_PHODC|nr:uncharacterized protein LOC103706534 [Phoenix dactylifera]